MKCYLALDLALANIGWVIYDSNFKLNKGGTFKNPKIADDRMGDLTHRAALMMEFGNRIIEQCNNNIIKIIVERPHGTRSMADACAFGVVASFCAYMKEAKNQNMIYVGAKEVKTFSNEIVPAKLPPKEKSFLVAKELEGIGFPTEHEADAVIAFYFWRKLVNPEWTI